MKKSVVILGGSNSLMKQGWVDHFLGKYASNFDVRNLSIGASTSAMGLFRLLHSSDVADGSTIVWEYALNEANYFARGQTLDSLIYHVEWVLNVCVRRNFKFVALVLYTKRESERIEPSLYKKRLFNLFDRYSVSYVDCASLLRSVAGGVELELDYWYSENPHYSVTTPFLPLLAEAAHEKIETASCPIADKAALKRFSGKELALCYPSGDKGVPFKNRILTCSKYPVIDGVVIPAKGRLLACIFITSASAGAVYVSSGGSRKGPYALQISSDSEAPLFLLKHLVLWNKPDDMLEADGEVRIDDFRLLGEGVNAENPIRQPTFNWEGYKDLPQEEGVVALLIEQQAERKSAESSQRWD